MITMMIITKTISILYLKTHQTTQSLTSPVSWTTYSRSSWTKRTENQCPGGDQATDQDTRTDTSKLLTGRRDDNPKLRRSLTRRQQRQVTRRGISLPLWDSSPSSFLPSLVVFFTWECL